MSKSKGRIVFDIRRFVEYLPPAGFLNNHVACHALMYYALIARSNYEEQKETIVLEDEPEKAYNYRQLMSSIATIYGCQPEEMVKFWVNVDMQFRTLDLPLVPQHLRQTDVPEIKTQ